MMSRAASSPRPMHPARCRGVRPGQPHVGLEFPQARHLQRSRHGFGRRRQPAQAGVGPVLQTGENSPSSGASIQATSTPAAAAARRSRDATSTARSWAGA